MLDPVEVAAKEFAESHLYTKLRKQILVARVWENQQETRSLYLGAYPFDLDDHELTGDIKADYDLIRATIQAKQPLSGRLGRSIQPRTKGAGGDAPKTRAFYARTGLVARLIDLDELNREFAALEHR